MSTMDKDQNLPSDIKKEIKAIKQDHIHGSTFLFHKAISILKKMNSKKLEFSQETIDHMVFDIIHAQPTMALLVNLSNDYLFALSEFKKKYKNQEKIVQSLRSFLQTYEQKITNADEAIQFNANKQFRSIDTLATYSSSGTIQKTIESLAKQNSNLVVFCSESRPKHEGTKLAKTVAGQGIQVKLMTDATLFSYIQKVKAIIIGADAITKQGIINKIGSYPLAVLAQKHNIPFYCVTQSYKILPEKYEIPDESPKPSRDIIQGSSSKLNVINYYFDTTPFSLISKVITEKGIQNPKEIQGEIQHKTLHHKLQKRM